LLNRLNENSAEGWYLGRCQAVAEQVVRLGWKHFSSRNEQV
jgi:hypothetical protein